MGRVDSDRLGIGEKLPQRRRSLGMTQQECAQLLGLPRLAVLRIERGYRRIRLPELERICDVVGCTAEDLLGDAGLANAAAFNYRRLYDADATQPDAPRSDLSRGTVHRRENTIPVFSLH